MEITRDNPAAPLVLTKEDLAAFDPMTRLAARMMIANGKAILEEGGTS